MIVGLEARLWALEISIALEAILASTKRKSLTRGILNFLKSDKN
jgi:hypothetical protein